MAKITLTWIAATGPVASYNIYRSTSTFDSTNFKSTSHSQRTNFL